MRQSSSNSIKNNRHKAFIVQSGLCYYCKQPMWEKDHNSFISKYKLNPSNAQNLQCTAEHLIARKDGGSNSKSNIVAACKFCNCTRHKSKKPLNPENYKVHVQKRLKNKKWHQLVLNQLGSNQTLS